MTTLSYQVSAKEERRVRAVLALLKGRKASHVSVEFGINRSDLYKLRAHALVAMRAALKDNPRGPRRAHNCLSDERERRIVAICERYPTWSSYRVKERLGTDAPNPRTIQRVRERLALARVPKRAPPLAPARSLAWQDVERARHVMMRNWHLGPERISWDLQNGEGIRLNPSTIKRLKRQIYDAEPPTSPPPQWRFYERRHPHSLWHGDFMEKVTLTDLDRIAYVGRMWKGKEVTFVETLEGIEAVIEGRCVAVMKDYWKYRRLQGWERRTIPPRVYFKQNDGAVSPLTAVAQ